MYSDVCVLKARLYLNILPLSWRHQPGNKVCVCDKVVVLSVAVPSGGVEKLITCLQVALLRYRLRRGFQITAESEEKKREWSPVALFKL